MEVNLSPSLACDAPLDSVIKTNLLCDTLNIAEILLVRQENIHNMTAEEEEDEHMDTNDQDLPKTNEQDPPNSNGVSKDVPFQMAYMRERRRKICRHISKIKKAHLNHKVSL